MTAARLPLVPAMLALLASLVAIVVGYLALNVPGAWFPASPPKRFDVAQMGVSRGQAQALPGALAVSTPSPEEPAVVVLKAGFRSRDYAGIEWIVAGLPDGADVRLLWRTDYQPERLNAAAMSVDRGRLRAVAILGDPGWVGTITDLGLAVRASPAAAFEVRGVVARPFGAVELARERVGEWMAFEGWRATSVDTLAGGADTQDLPLPIVLALATLLAGLAYALLRRLLPAIAPYTSPAFAIAVFAAAWGVTELRHGWNSARQSQVTASTFGGAGWREAHLAAEDAALFQLVEKASASIGEPRSRVFVLAEAPYFRARAAYYFYPHNPWFDLYGNAAPAAPLMRAGDYVFAFRRRGVQFNAALQRLRIDGGAELPAEAVLVAGDGSLFRLK